MSSRVSGSRHEFIALDFSRDASVAVAGGFYTNHLAMTTNINFAVSRYMLRKSEYEFNFVANFKTGFRQEVKAAITDVSCLGFQFCAVRIARLGHSVR